MRDPRADNLAKILVGYSTKVEEGDTVVIDGESAAEPLLLAIYEETLKAGGQPMLNVGIDGQAAAYFKLASDAQIDWVSPIAGVDGRRRPTSASRSAPAPTPASSRPSRPSARPGARRRPAS